MKHFCLKAIAFFVPCALWAQLGAPAGTQVYSYFPQIADGGPGSQKWITTFTFTNPGSYAAHVWLDFYDNNGQALALDLGSGPTTEATFIVGPESTATFATTGTTSGLRVGWAIAGASMPLQSVAQYRDLTNGVPQQGVSVPAIPASMEFTSPATASSGIAVANPWAVNAPVNVTLLDAHGSTVQQTNFTLAPLGHAAFNLNQIFPSLPSNFRGTVQIASASLNQPWIVALILSADGGVLSSYPAAEWALPVSQYERISKIWYELVNVALNTSGTRLTKEPTLVVDGTHAEINSYACPWINPWCSASDLNSVHVFLNMAELLSDSDGELAFIIAHELGHIIQGQGGAASGTPYLLFNKTDIEWDADQWGLWLSLGAGYDPYSGAGALGRLYTAGTGVSTTGVGTGLLAKNFDGSSNTDPHGSLMQRLGNIWNGMVFACAQPAMSASCTAVKTLFHPHFPSTAPMDKSSLESLDRSQKQPHFDAVEVQPVRRPRSTE